MGRRQRTQPRVQIRTRKQSLHPQRNQGKHQKRNTRRRQNPRHGSRSSRPPPPETQIKLGDNMILGAAPSFDFPTEFSIKWHERLYEKLKGETFELKGEEVSVAVFSRDSGEHRIGDHATHTGTWRWPSFGRISCAGPNVAISRSRL